MTSDPFPNLTKIRKTSDATDEYNCIAWAFGDNTRFWWPSDRFCYWPDRVDRENNLDAFIELFKQYNFEETDISVYEEGHLKIALYCLDGEPTHAARQLSSGDWTSKLGKHIDIAHDLEDLEGPQYGKIEKIYAKKI